MSESDSIAEEYVAWALANGFSTTDIACALGYPQVSYPTQGQIVELVAFVWRAKLAPIALKRAA